MVQCSGVCQWGYQRDAQLTSVRSTGALITRRVQVLRQGQGTAYERARGWVWGPCARPGLRFDGGEVMVLYVVRLVK